MSQVQPAPFLMGGGLTRVTAGHLRASANIFCLVRARISAMTKTQPDNRNSDRIPS